MGSSIRAFRFNVFSPKLICLPVVGNINNKAGITYIKRDIGGLYMQTISFNSITYLLSKKDDLLGKIVDLEEIFKDIDRYIEDNTIGLVDAADLDWPGNPTMKDLCTYLKERERKKDDFIGTRDKEIQYHVCESGDVEREKRFFLEIVRDSAKEDAETLKNAVAKGMNPVNLEDIRARVRDLEKDSTTLLKQWTEYHGTVHGDTEENTEVETNVETVVDNTDGDAEEKTEVNSKDNTWSEEPVNQDSSDWFDLS